MKIEKLSGLLPIDRDIHLPNPFPCVQAGDCFLAADVRVDENNALAALHTVFIREHNRIVTALKGINPNWGEEKLYQEGRKIVVGIFQNIVWQEYVPTLTTVQAWSGYKDDVDASSSVAFATAAYRFGHSEVPNFWAMLNNNYDKIREPFLLRDLFFNNAPLRQYGIEPITFGLLGNETQNTDATFAETLHKFLFVFPGARGHMDLLAINIQRGRDHGLPGYWHWRKWCKLGESKNFESLAQDFPDKAMRDMLRDLYEDKMELVDLFAAGIAETHEEGKAVGRTFGCILADQFERMRDGDRFYYENPDVFTPAQLVEIKKMTIAKVFCHNLRDIVSIQRNAFKVATTNTPRVTCDSIDDLDLNLWKE